MKPIIRAFAASLALAFLTTPAYSAESGTTWFGDTADGQFLIGIKAGTLDIEDSLYGTANNFTLVLGYQFARTIGDHGSAAIELELGDSYDDGDLKITPPGYWEGQTVGLFMSYRTPGTVYFKGKLGFQDTDIRTRDVGVELPDQGDTAFAFGAGLGLLLGAEQNFNLELEWTGTAGDNDAEQLTLGGLMRF